MNVGVNSNLNSISANIFFPEAQVAAWGAVAAYQPIPELELAAGVYDASISLHLLQAAGGLLYHGIIPGRNHDVAAVSVIAGVFSNRAPAHGTETVIEANHRIQLTPWLYLTPDFQYVIHPNDAAVLAGELSINF